MPMRRIWPVGLALLLLSEGASAFFCFRFGGGSSSRQLSPPAFLPPPMPFALLAPPAYFSVPPQPADAGDQLPEIMPRAEPASFSGQKWRPLNH